MMYVNSSFTILKWGVRGYSLHGLVCMMYVRLILPYKSGV